MNKPRKTRIKVLHKVDGSVGYIPQHKGWLFWYDFDDYDGYSPLTHTNAMRYAQSLTTLQSAQHQIDNYIEAFNKEEIKRKGGVITKTEYVKYP